MTRDDTAHAVTCIELGDSRYPRLLAAIHDPPAALHARGSAGLGVLSLPAVAIVGSRACSPYGAQVARSVARAVAAAGAVVVSGLARGIDAEAHRGALEAGGVTVAVLGCGVDRDYPAAHAALAARIRECGLVISEYEAGTPPAPWQFPARNRIIAGLCAATVIVEARERSGALITADFALEEGREVFVVPGEITSSLSRGTNQLLRQGAAPLLDPEDALDPLGLTPLRSPPPVLAAATAAVLAAVRAGAPAIDDLARATGLAASAVAAALAELEVLGQVSGRDGRYRAAAGAP